MILILCSKTYLCHLDYQILYLYISSQNDELNFKC